MDDFDSLEKAGHDLTLVNAMLQGISTYYCEKCGALVQFFGLEGRLRIFHQAPGHPTKTSQCVELPSLFSNGKSRTLKTKLTENEGPVNPNIPKVCNGCEKPLLLESLYVDDGCPCNTPRGVNFKPQPCTICKTDNCVKPGHRLEALYGFST